MLRHSGGTEMTEILVLEKPEEKLRRERERLLGELSVYGERLAVLQDTVDEIKEMIEYYDEAIENLGTDELTQSEQAIADEAGVHTISDLLATYENGGENGKVEN